MKKNIFTKLLVLMLAAATVFTFASCGKGAEDGTNDGTGDTGNVNPPDGENGDDSDVDPENLTLITNNKAKFKIILTSQTDSSLASAVADFISDLRDLGVDIENSAADSDKDAVTDREIIIGTGVENRDEKYSLDPRDYGEDGYVIKVVDNKVLIGGGNKQQTKIAFDYFVKNVVKLTGKTKEMSELSVERSYERLKETKYLIESIKIGGVDFNDFVFVTDLGECEIEDFESVDSFRENIYSLSGYWLDTAKPDSVPGARHVFSVKLVEDAGENGFRAYVDTNGNFNVECAYANALDKAFETLVDSTFAEAIGDLEIKKTFEKSYPVNVVYYSQFGAVGNGVANDHDAIYNAHAFANISGQKVMGDKDAVYYISTVNNTAIIKTDVDWNGAKFVIEDRGSVIYSQRNKHLFSIMSDFTAKTFNESEIKALFGDKSIKFGDTEIPWLAEYIEGTSFVTIRNQHEDFIRWGGHIMSQQRQDIVIIEPTGKLNEKTPIIWDFEAGEQIVNTGRRCIVNKHSNFSHISIRRVDDEPITVKNGKFERYSNEVVAETGFQNIYHAYSRGISVSRSNVTLDNVDHKILWEPDMPTSGYGQNEKGEFKQGYPYGGFLLFSSCFNCNAIGCDLNAHTCFYEHKDSTANPTAMGSYDLNITSSCSIYLEGITNGVDHCDNQYWGIMHSNKSKDLNFKNCTMNRFDAHEGVWGATFDSCEFGFNINLIGGGPVRIVNTKKCVGNSFISMRVDYGSTFNGTLEIIDCTLEGMKGYRGGRPEDPSYYTSADQLYIVSSSYDTESIYKGTFDYNNMQTFPYLKWNFGYQRYLPQHVTIDNFKCNAEKYGAKLYLYPNYDNACFYKPADFLQESDYMGIDVVLPDGTTRPMTEDDVYYGPLMITQSVTYRNMKNPIPICPDSSLYLSGYITERIVIEND